MLKQTYLTEWTGDKNMTKKLLLIVNNITGNNRNAVRTFDIVRNFSKYGYEVTVFPVYPESQLSLQEYLERYQYDRVVCVGGDGTLSHTVNNVMKLDYKPVIGYLPAGTTNDFSKNFDLTTDIDTACEIIASECSVEYDLGVFNDKYFNYVASFGPLSATSYNTDQKAKNMLGYAAYILNGIGSIGDILSSRCHVRVETENRTFEGDYIFGAISNSLSVAGMKVNGMTRENLSDGLFELTLIRYPENGNDLMSIADSLINGNYSTELVEMCKIRQAKIHTDNVTEWTIDGEYGGVAEKADFSIIPAAVKLSARI